MILYIWYVCAKVLKALRLAKINILISLYKCHWGHLSNKEAPGGAAGATMGEDSHGRSPLGLQRGGVEVQIGRLHR